jgi:chemotaxis protein methyltransferase CheR
VKTRPELRLIEDPQFPRLKAFLIDATGMVFYADKDSDLAHVVGIRLKALETASCADYLAMLEHPNGGRDELDAVIAEMTIGETYFFRHREQFDALRDTIFPEIIERNRDVRRLRVWSAGCATGPEPYSIAILLRQQFGSQIEGWNVNVLGTDINQKFLARAREGRYDEWAFRSVPEEVKQRSFTKHGKQWLINPEYREMVTFQYHNLITNAFPSVINNLAAFDLIICRNVIIYFSQETVRGLLPRFYDTLVDRGWLIMGHAESNVDLFRDFRTVNSPGAVMYQKVPREELARGEARPWVPPCAAGTVPPQPAPVKRVIPAPRPVIAMPAPPPPPVARPAPSADPRMAELARLGDSGAWEKAETLCCQMLEMAPLDPILHHYHGMVLEQMGRLPDSEQALRRAIYLDRNFILPHYHLGLLGLRLGDRTKAGRSFRNALGLLTKIDERKVLAEAEGLTAAQLKEMVVIHLDMLGAK